MDELINDLGGCGKFQYIVGFFGSWPRILGSMSMYMMSFGNYNPGWRCLDNSTITNASWDNITVDGLKTSSNDKDMCRHYEACNNVQFKPGISTVVTEWNLICDRAWISSFIISIQMVGVLLGSYLCGYFGDKIGRKRTMYGATIFHLVMNFIAIFSNSWEMFVAMRFLIGLAIPVMFYVPFILLLEFAKYKWRNALFCMPVSAIGGFLFAFSAMLTEDWRYIHGINAIVSLICIFPSYWMPESLRWLVVRDKMKEASDVVNNIVKLNGKEDHRMGLLEKICLNYRKQPQSNGYHCFHLLRRNVLYPTFVVGISCITMSVVYYVILFSIQSLPGNLYTNMFIMFAIEIPVSAISSFLPNYTGRKVSIIIFLGISSLSLFGIVGLDLLADDSLQSTGILVCALTARATADPAWDVMVTYVGELYPTVIRSTGIAYTSWVARIGLILAPYLIHNDPEVYFINYLIMASLAFACFVFIIFLPEAKKKELPDVWENTMRNLILLRTSADVKDDTAENSSYIVSDHLSSRSMS